MSDLVGNPELPGDRLACDAAHMISEVIIVVLNSFLEEAQKLMHEIFEDEMVLDFVGIPDSEYMETADSLRQIKDKIKV